MRLNRRTRTGRRSTQHTMQSVLALDRKWFTSLLCLSALLHSAQSTARTTRIRATPNEQVTVDTRVVDEHWQEAPSKIPGLLHFSWKTGEIPDRFMAAKRSWTDLHPDWAVRLWTDEGNRVLVQQHFPWFLKFYDGLPHPIMRADAARVLYMYHYGGIYADLDVYALRSFEPLLANGTLFVGMIGNDTEWAHNIPNAWFASVPRHPLWLICLAEMIGRAAVCAVKDTECGAEYVTGPIMLKYAIQLYQHTHLHQDVTVLPPGMIFPLDWHRDRPDFCSQVSMELFDLEKCVALFPDAYSVSFWAHSWGRRRLEELPDAEGPSSSSLEARPSLGLKPPGTR